MLGSSFAPGILAVAALLAAVVRWFAQGTQNVYTSLAQRFYIPDPDFGWRESAARPIWLGLEGIALLVGVTGACLVAGWWIRRRERKTERRASVLRALCWLAAAASAVPAAAAFASGAGPAHGRLTLPVGATAAAPTSGVEGRLDAPAGTYEVRPHRGTVVTAKIAAGGDEFDARFAQDLAGQWQLTPGDFTKPMTAEISVATAAVDTGITLRSEHARTEYLHAAKFPRISFSLQRVLAVRQDSPSLIAFRGAGVVELVGTKTEVEITGTVETADADKRARLDLGDASAVLLVQADLTLPIARTGLTASDYDSDKIPIHVSLVLTHHP
ncbi:MAG: YceI family protein [Kofleriaceae bacterium]